MTDTLPPIGGHTVAVLGAAPDDDRLPAFLDQFLAWHRSPDPVQLLITLHPALHHEHLRDTVDELMGVNGVVHARLVRPWALGLSDEMRARMTNYRVRIMPTRDVHAMYRPADAEPPAEEAGDDTPMLTLYNPVTRHVLVAALWGADGISQRDMDLSFVLDQVLRYEAEAAEADVEFEPSEIRLGWRCRSCRTIAEEPDDEERPTAPPPCDRCGRPTRPVTLVWTPTVLEDAGDAAGEGEAAP